MPKPLLATEIMEPELEAMRLAALVSTGILDTGPEACYDAITRLCADYFKAESVHLGFADESRVWIKSFAGPSVREIPRRHSTFEMVLAARWSRGRPRSVYSPRAPKNAGPILPAPRTFLRQRPGPFQRRLHPRIVDNLP